MLNAEFGTIHRQKKEANHGKSGKATARAGARCHLVHGDKLCNQVRGYADYALFHPSARRSRLRNIFAVYERAGCAVGGAVGVLFLGSHVPRDRGILRQKAELSVLGIFRFGRFTIAYLPTSICIFANSLLTNGHRYKLSIKK